MTRLLTLAICILAGPALAQDISGPSLMERMMLTELEQEMLDNPDVQNCDRLAGPQHHPDRNSGAMIQPGKSFSAVDGPAGEIACRAALVAYPDHPRLLASLGSALSKQDLHNEAFAAFMKAAEQGDPAGQTSTGFSNYYGWGTAKSYPVAIEWFEKAYAQGHPGAMFALGLLRQEGHAYPRDNAAALRYYQEAAEAGSADGAGLLGRMYEHGIAIGTDADRAADLYITALQGGTSWIYSHKPNWKRATGRALQSRLKELGYYTGSIDGSVGPATRAAMAALWADSI